MMRILLSTVLAILPADEAIDWYSEMEAQGVTVSGQTTRKPEGRTAAPRAAAAPEKSDQVQPLDEFLRVVACPGSSTDNPRGGACDAGTRLCAGRTGVGVMTRIYTRAAGTTQPWDYLTQTCDPEAVTAPAAPAAAGPTLADIQREFARTEFALPNASVQPPDGQTLIGLPVFFTATWSTAGYRPGQTRTLTLLGHQVDLAITLDHYVYTFGDGASSGPTASPGGPYPAGDIRHPYRTAGRYAPTVTAVLGATYRVDGGAWQPVRDTAQRTGTLAPLTVHAATNRLYP